MGLAAGYLLWFMSGVTLATIHPDLSAIKSARGLWAGEGIVIDAPPPGGKAAKSVPSPDRASWIEIQIVVPKAGLTTNGDKIDDDAAPTVSIAAGGAIGKTASKFWPAVGAEVLWSRDSKAYAVTIQGGGRLNMSRLEAGWKDRNGNTYPIVIDMVFRRAYAEILQDCLNPSISNVGAVAWLDGQRLLVAAEPAKHSGCMGTVEFRLYEYDISRGAIVRRYDAREAREAFGDLLGSHLASDDGALP